MQPDYRQVSFNKNHCNELENLKNVLLAINFNFPHYSSIPILKEFYGPIFGKVVFCGSKEFNGVIKIKERRGYLGYECVATAIRMFPNFIGYLYSNDDIILNWWNVIKLDTSKIWTGGEIQYTNPHVFDEVKLPAWSWWKAERTAYVCQVAFEKVVLLGSTKEGIRLKLPSYIQRYYINTGNRKLCIASRSDLFYIPKEYAETYARISQIYEENNVFLEAAVPGILIFLLNKTNQHNLNGMYFNDITGYSPAYESGEAFYETYSFNLTFSHPFKFEGKMKAANWNFFKNVVMAYGKKVKRYCMLPGMEPVRNHFSGPE